VKSELAEKKKTASKAGKKSSKKAPVKDELSGTQKKNGGKAGKKGKAPQTLAARRRKASKAPKAPLKPGEIPFKKPHRFRPGTVALREIRRYQKTTEPLIPKRPLERLIREVTQEYKVDARFTTNALVCIREILEVDVTKWFELANIAAIHAKRVTVMPKDMEVVRRIIGNGAASIPSGGGGYPTQ
jgi:histone H3